MGLLHAVFSGREIKFTVERGSWNENENKKEIFWIVRIFWTFLIVEFKVGNYDVKAVILN